MGEDSRAAQGTDNYYGTFQGVANYWPPLPPPPLTAFPQPAPPPGTTFAVHPNTAFYSNGYQTSITTGYAMVDGTPLTVGPTAGHGRLPCCGLGMGWVLFVVGFFLGGIPWYVGTFLLLYTQLDIREKPGYIACVVASAIAFVAMTFGVSKGAHTWWSLS